MPQQYVRKEKGYANVSHDDMLLAVQDVEVGVSLRKAAAKHSVSKSVLGRYVAKHSANPDARLQPNYQHSLVFTAEEENVLSEYLIQCSKMFHGVTPKQAREIAYQMALKNGKEFPESWAENEEAGREWMKAFMKRNSNLTLRKPEATSLARAGAFNRHNVEEFFGNLSDVLKKTGVSGGRILNLDETGFTTVQRPAKVLAGKGERQVGKVTSAERGELVTMCVAVTATGGYLPPAFVFPRKILRESLMEGTPECSLQLCHSSGWMTPDNFETVIKHIVKHMSATKENPVVLILDNHVSHVSLNVLMLAKESGVHIVTLPPHTSHKLQPLDVAVFGPMKTSFNKQVDSWMLQNPGKPLRLLNMGKLMGLALIRSATPANILSGFRAAGIWPLDSEIFTDDDFLPASVTDRPEPKEASVPEGAIGGASEATANEDEDEEGHSPEPPPLSRRSTEPVDPELEQPPFVSNEPDAVPGPSWATASPGNQEKESPSPSVQIVSPQEFRGYPKVSPFCYNLLLKPLTSNPKLCLCHNTVLSWLLHVPLLLPRLSRMA